MIGAQTDKAAGLGPPYADPAAGPISVRRQATPATPIRVPSGSVKGPTTKTIRERGWRCAAGCAYGRLVAPMQQWLADGPFPGLGAHG
jgi:hypothetical protein